jgi:hypothetical protein
MDWEECMKKRIVKKINIDEELINSLIQTSKNKSISGGLLDLNETTSCSIISLYYDSLRELLEALSVKNGYKIYNHEGYTYFLKEVLHKEKVSNAFDGIRKIRNGINYYGKQYPLSDSKIIIKDIKELINKCKLLLK